MQWLFFTRKLRKASDEYLLAGDEVVIDKAGKATFALGRFFSSIHQRQYRPFRSSPYRWSMCKKVNRILYR